MMVHNERIIIKELVTREIVTRIVTDNGTMLPLPASIANDYEGLEDWQWVIGREFNIEIVVEGESAKVIALKYINPFDEEKAESDVRKR